MCLLFTFYQINSLNFTHLFTQWISNHRINRLLICTSLSLHNTLRRRLKHFFFNVSRNFLFLDISNVFCVYFIFLWTLKFFYLGHVKKSLYNTIQYNTIITKFLTQWEHITYTILSGLSTLSPSNAHASRRNTSAISVQPTGSSKCAYGEFSSPCRTYSSEPINSCNSVQTHNETSWLVCNAHKKIYKKHTEKRTQ